MSSEDIVRYWKDPDFRASVTPDQRGAFPEHPSGPVELADADVADVRGGTWLACLSVLLSFCIETLCSCECTGGLECGFESAKVCI